MNLNTLKAFRHATYGCLKKAADAQFNLVDALLSEDRARSLPELSLSPHFVRKWSSDMILPEAASQSFWFHDSPWQLPDFENAKTFVNRLVRAGLLVRDPMVNALLQEQPQEISSRTVRRRFLLATGLTPKRIEQIERAQQAAALLEQGISLLDVVYQVGYTDQPHMTRSLKRFLGQTPAQIARLQNGGDAW